MVKVTSRYVINILTHQDRRYLDPKSADEVAEFINDKAITLETQDILEFRESLTSSSKDLEIWGPQEREKYLATKLLNSLGGEVLNYEVRIRNGIVDALGKLNGKTIKIECGPCRIDKAIHYLREENSELWVIASFFEEATLTILKRGPNWDKKIKEFDDAWLEVLKSIKSPLDSLYD